MRLAALTAALLLLGVAARGEEAVYGASLKLLASHTIQEPATTAANPDNLVLALPRSLSLAQARLDLSLDYGPLHLFALPRGYATRTETRSGGEVSSDTDTESKLLQGGARAGLKDSLFLSLARENLQWGPAQSVNPSNPFFPQNGRENPMREIGGSDFVRLVWLPATGYTLSLIVNTGKGEEPEPYGGWKPSRAIKLDWTGETGAFGALFHAGPDVPVSMGGYGQWTATDALLLYGEFRVLDGNRHPYPVADASPVGAHLEAKYAEGGHQLYKALAGLSYTLEAGPTLTFEYFRNGEGYDGEEAGLFADLGAKAGGFVKAGLAKPSRIRGLGSVPLRRNYATLQFLQTEIRNHGTLLLRYTANLDDSSGAATLYGDWAVGDALTLFCNGAVFFGDARSEYGMGLDYQAVLGMEIALF